MISRIIARRAPLANRSELFPRSGATISITKRLTFANTRFYSSSANKDSEDKKKDKNDETEQGKDLETVGKSNRELTSDEINFSPDLSPKVSKPSGAPAAMPMNEALLSKPKTKYVPKESYDRVTYEFHAPPKPSEIKAENIKKKYRQSRLMIFIPTILTSIFGAWAIYTYSYFNVDEDEDPRLLAKDKFLPYLVTYKKQIDKDHFIIELTRKKRGKNLFNPQSKVQMFDGKKFWSVEIKQPDINIVRNYTPLPLYVAGIDPDTEEPLFRLVRNEHEEGKFILYIKKYGQGEMTRWLSNLNLLAEVELRGPFEEYKFPFHPLDKCENRPQLNILASKVKPDPDYPENLPPADNMIFFGAGTGIAPALQLLYSKNPPKGFFDVHVSLKNSATLPNEFLTLNYFLEKLGRAKFHYYYSDSNEKPTAKDVPYPQLKNFTGVIDLNISEELYKQKLLKQKKEEVRKQLGTGNNATSSGGDDSSSTTSDDNSEVLIDDGSSLPADQNSGKPRIIITETSKEMYIPNYNPKLMPQNAVQQYEIEKKLKKLKGPSQAFVCGPESYIEYISGRPDLNNAANVDVGEIGGILKERKWDKSNIKRLI
ncbi:hypothetical protein B5S31_g1228 [[Candida] boidinii]|nr:hypothetical protein B5S29_g553 [[Candida] boidinii]OWB71538.1 hypothetical protein B5S31_g1228 [[Candida] boidinii]